MSAKLQGLRLIAAFSLLTVAAAANAQSDESTYSPSGDNAPSAGAMAVDILVLRPLSLVGTVLGTAVFVAGLPFEAIAGDVSDPARRLVAEPAAFTFTRPLGEIH